MGSLGFKDTKKLLATLWLVETLAQNVAVESDIWIR